MKRKKEIIVLLIIILALSFYLIKRNRDRSLYQLPELPRVVSSDITKIEILKYKETIVLDKKGGGWEIAPNGYPADIDVVNNMLEVLENLALTALVSESKSYHRYDLHEEQKIIVKAMVDDRIGRDFEIGKEASSRQHTFIKLAHDHRVYHAQNDFRWKFDQTVDSLRDKVVLEFDKATAQEIHITKRQESILLTRTQVTEEESSDKKAEEQSPSKKPATKTIWKSQDNREADEPKIDTLLKTVSDLSCFKYLDNDKKDDLTDPIFVIRIKAAKDYSLSFFAKRDDDSKEYPAISSENEYPFLLSERDAKDIMIGPEDLFPKPSTSED